MVERLCTTPELKTPVRNHRNITSSNNEVFDRLYLDSTGKIEITHEKQKRWLNMAPDEGKQNDLTNEMTHSIITTRETTLINDAFAGLTIISKDAAQQIFIELGILEPKEDLSHASIIKRSVHWKTYDDQIDANTLKDDLLKALTTNTPGKFMSFVRRRMSMKQLNLRRSSSPPVVQERSTSRTVASKESIERLMKPKPIPPPPPDPDENFVVVPTPLSPGTQEILRHSLLAKKSLEERSDELTRRASTRLSKLAHEVFNEKYKTKLFSSDPPEITQEEREKIQERKLRRQCTEEKPPFKPNLTPYQEFLAIKEDMVEEKPRPPGWEESIRRQELARQKRAKQKEEEERLSHFPPPIVKKKRKNSLPASEIIEEESKQEEPKISARRSPIKLARHT